MLALWNLLITILWPLLYLYTPFRGTIGKRLGNFPLEAYNPDATGLKFVINAVSAGEVVAITPFIRELKTRLPDCQVVLLTTTDSGQTMAREKLGDAIDLLAYFPLIDLPFVVRKYLNRLKPDVYITTESELWPNIMNAFRRNGLPVALVNARIYLHNKTGLRRYVVRESYRLINLIVCQDERQQRNFTTFGLPSEQLVVSGNTKFDFDLSEWGSARLEAERTRFGITRKVVVAGSTHPGEEELVLASLEAGPDGSVKPQLVIAPRHIERAQEVAAECRNRGWDARLLSEHSDGQPIDALIVDAYGVLTDMYQLADVVIMGGTFHPKVGGHNILEATVLGKPVVVGEYRFSITAQVDMLAEDGGIVVLDDESSLADELTGLLGDAGRRGEIGQVARRISLANRGSAKRAVDAVLGLVR